MTKNTNGRALAARGLFSSDDAAELLGRNPGEPTGVTVEVGGVTFDLRPMSVGASLPIFELLRDFGRVQQATAAGEIGGLELMTFAGERAPELVSVAKNVLKAAAEIDPDDADSVARFDRWFDGLPLRETVQRVLRRVWDAEGFSTLAEATKTDPRPLRTASTTTRSRPSATS
jgi:hypothetical protein